MASRIPTSLMAAVSLALLAQGAACGGSTQAARCPDGSTPEAPKPGCPECPPAPRPAAPPVVVDAATMPTDREQRLSLVAFSADGATALLRVEDDAVGDFFKTVDLAVTPVPKLVKTWLFQSLTEVVAEKQAMRALKPVAPGPASQVNKAGVALLATDDGDTIAVLAMKGERAVVVATLPRLKDADGVRADVSVVKLAWDPTGTRALVIHEQRLAAAPGFTSQWLHVIAVDAARLPF